MSDLSDDAPGSTSILGPRKRSASILQWSPRTKTRLTEYAGDVAGELGVPESSRAEFMSASTLPTHKLLIFTLAAVLTSGEDASSHTRLLAYLTSTEFKDNVIGQIRGVLLDPKLPSYKIGFLHRLVMLSAWNTKMSIYELVKSLAWKSSQEMTDTIWARFAWAQMKLIDYKNNGGKDEGFWDHIDELLAERRANVFEEALKVHLVHCKPKNKWLKSSTKLPRWQEDISRAVAEMDAYTLEQLAEEEEVEEDPQDLDGEVVGAGTS
ncbi:hypothetical protein B0H17DRAFT_1151596 [Mycena rosella]|uniref:Uncharacterized protein n=1 Tax=Mycena rosella TaxID=1033263 RepID=A0AAD7BJP7_MYCRO|nr:hypothetical protein B0H17DRAFT_1151596 [Mycena rosella]